MSYEAAPTPTPTAPAATPGPASGVDPNSDLGKFLQQYKAAGTGGTTDIFGSEAGSDLVVRSNGSLHPNGTEPLMKISDVMYQFWQRDQKWIDALAAKLVKANFLPSVNVTRSDVWEAFRSNVLMDAASQYASSPNKASTVEQILQGYMKHPVGDAGGQPKPQHYTTTNTQVSLSDPTQADGLLKQTLEDRLGRAPTDAEKHAFLAALNAAQRKDPSVTTTNYSLNAKTGGYDTTTGQTSGGIDPTQFADDYASKNNTKEYGAYQAATTYFDAMMSALGSPGGV